MDFVAELDAGRIVPVDGEADLGSCDRQVARGHTVAEVGVRA